MKYIDADKLIAEIEGRVEETKSMKPAFDQFWAGQISAFKGALKIIASLQQEPPEVDLEKEIIRYQREDMDRDTTVGDVARHFYGIRNRALEEAARHVYESWMGGTTNDVCRHMVNLGKELNARKEK